MGATGELMVVVVTRVEARVWTSLDVPGASPESFRVPSQMHRLSRGRRWRHHHAHDVARDAVSDGGSFFDAVTRSVSSAERILLVGHGRGKANAMLILTQYWERQHPDVAHKVIGAIDSDLDALTDNEIMALAHEWFVEHREFI
jgi:hypothetical protein